MKIYTKKGDAGETSLYGGVRVSKAHMRIRTYGTYDELNSVLGLVLTEKELPEVIKTRLTRVQGELFQLGAELATPDGKQTSSPLIGEGEIQNFEHEIDEMEALLPPLTHFILPGGTRMGALIHLARTVSRRGEREVVVLHQAEPLRQEVLQYINRLSDYLFVTARFANLKAGGQDVPWVAGSSKSGKAT